MKKFLRPIAVLCALFLILASFMGCNKQETQPPDNNITGTNTKSGEKVNLRFSWWGGEERHQATLKVIDIYTKRNSNVTIDAEYSGWDGYQQRLMTQLAGKTAPDIIQIDPPWVHEIYAEREAFIDLNTISDVVDFSNFDKDFLEDYCVKDGKLQGLPAGINGEVFLMNKDLFAQAGIPLDTKWTWDNLLELGPKVNQYDPESYFLYAAEASEFFITFCRKFVQQRTGKSWINENYEIQFTRNDLVEMYTYLVKLVDNKVLPPFEEIAPYVEKEHPKWAQGKFAAMIEWVSRIIISKDFVSSDVQVSSLPILDGAVETGITVRPSMIECLNIDSKNSEEAAKFLNFFFNDEEAIVALGTVRAVPANSNASKLLVEKGMVDELQSQAVEISSQNAGTPQNGAEMHSEILQIDLDIFQQVGFKKITPEEAADTLLNLYKQKLSEIKSR